MEILLIILLFALPILKFTLSSLKWIDSLKQIIPMYIFVAACTVFLLLIKNCIHKFL